MRVEFARDRSRPVRTHAIAEAQAVDCAARLVLARPGAAPVSTRRTLGIGARHPRERFDAAVRWFLCG